MNVSTEIADSKQVSLTTYRKEKGLGKGLLTARQGHGAPNPAFIPEGAEAARSAAIRPTNSLPRTPMASPVPILVSSPNVLLSLPSRSPSRPTLNASRSGRRPAMTSTWRRTSSRRASGRSWRSSAPRRGLVRDLLIRLRRVG